MVGRSLERLVVEQFGGPLQLNQHLLHRERVGFRFAGEPRRLLKGSGGALERLGARC